MPAVRIAFERLLHHECQAIKTPAHVGVAGRQPHSRAARDRDHRRRLPFESAFISAATVAASTAPVIRIRPPVGNSISITPVVSGAGGGDSTPGSDKTATGGNADGDAGRPSTCPPRKNITL